MSRAQNLIAVGLAVPAVMLALAIIWPMLARDDEGSVLAFPGFSLVQPVLALTAAEFPDPNIGISAYLQIASPTLDLDAPPASLFDDVTHGGDNFVIGQFLPPRHLTNPPSGPGSPISFIEVTVYIDNQGWIMAYLPNDVLAVEIVSNFTDRLTVLEDAIDAAAIAAGVSSGISGLEEQIGYFHWAYPSASHLAVARKDVAGNLYFAVPETAFLWEASIDQNCVSQTPFEPFGGPAQVCAPTDVVSFPLMDGVPLGRRVIGGTGIPLASVISKPTGMPTGGPVLGQVQSVELGGNWLGVALVYQIPAP